MEPQEFGPYLLVEQIAVGGMAQIYLAKTHGIAGFEKYLALKLLHPSYATDDQFVNMLIEEAKIAVRLTHANIAQVFDLGRSDDGYYIAMEFVDGADLFKIMRRLSEREIDVPIDVAVYIAQELCTGLDYAHRQRDHAGRALNIIHRDISPQNILISRSGEVKIVDFGIAKATSRSQATQAGVIKGKYFYMSPEQAWGDPIDQRTDIFSAGIILYEVLTGQMLYLQEDMQKLIELVRRAEIPPPHQRRPEIPPELEQILMKALAKRPEDRWQSAHDFQLALTHFLFSHAPDFTPARLASVVSVALEDVEEDLDPTETDLAEQGEVRDGQVRTQQFPVEDLMSRDDFRPKDEQSVIFSLEDLGVVEDPAEDPGEATTVSARPRHIGSEMAIAFGEEEWEEVPGDPTLVTRPPEQVELAEGSLPEVVIPLDVEREDPTFVEVRSTTAPRVHAMRPAATPPPIPPPSASWPPVGPNPGSSWPPFHPPPVEKDAHAPPPGRVVAPLSPNASRPTPALQLEWPPHTGRQTSVKSAPASPIQAGHRSAAPAPQAESPVSAAPPPLAADVVSRQLSPMSRPRARTKNPALATLPNVTEWPSAKTRRRKRLVIATLASSLTLASIGAIAFFAFWPIDDEPAVVQVISVPPGADVWLDGKKAPTPAGVSIPVADPTRPHHLEVRMPHYEPWSDTVTFPKGQRHVRALAVLHPVYGKLEVESDPAGADVYLNGEHRGPTPLIIEGLSLSEEISLELRKRGYRPETRTINWEDQRFRKVSLSLRRSR